MSDRVLQTLYFVSASFVIGGAAQYMYKHLFPSTVVDDEYKIIQKYLLNEAPLYSHNKPKLWIYLDYERNERDWIGTSFRSNTRLNKGYLYASISSIVHHCGDDFHVCLIDKTAFAHFIPGFDATTIPEQHLIEYGMLQLLYYYGGVVVPAAFICNQTLLPLYKTAVKENRIFVGERESRRLDASGIKPEIGPSLFFMGGPKNHPTIQLLSKVIASPNTAEIHPDVWCGRFVTNEHTRDKIIVVPGEWIGTRDANGQTIQTDHLIRTERPISWSSDCLGIAFWDKDFATQHRFARWLQLSETDIRKDPSNLGRAFNVALGTI